MDRDPFADMRRLLVDTTVTTIVDGGAYIGTVARLLAELFPDAVVYAFEPQAESFETLRDAVKDSDRVRPLPYALGAASSSKLLQVGVLPYTSSLLERPGSGKAYYPEGAVLTREQYVQVVALDDWAQQQGVQALDIIKLDVQGYELEVLRGAQRLLRSAVKLVYAEVSFVPLYEGTCLFHDLAEFLHRIGFSLYRLYDLHYADNGQLIYGDAIFVSPAVRASVLK